MRKALISTLILLAAFSARTAAQNVLLACNTQGDNRTPPEPTPRVAIPAASLPEEDAVAETALLESLNRSRREAGIAPVRMEQSLRQAALLHAQRMAAARVLDHQLPGEPALLQRIAKVSSLPLDRAGENIANVTCASEAHNLLMHSPPHRDNILDPRFNVAGIAAIWNGGHLFVVEDFAHASPAYSPSQTVRLVSRAIVEARQDAGLDNLIQLSSPDLNEEACSLAKGNHPNARMVAAAYSDRKTITYTQTRPEILSPAARRVLSDPSLRQFAVGSCYARNASYPTGTYWVAILLY